LTQRTGVAAAAAVVVLLGLNLRTVIASLPPLLADIRDDLGLSATMAGLLTTLPVLAFGALAPVVPRLGRSLSLERILLASAAATALGAGLRGIGTTGTLFAASVVAGCAVAVGQAALPALIRLRWASATGALMGAYSMALPLGATLAAAAAVPLERVLGGWEGSLAVWCLPAVLATAAWAFAVRGSSTKLAGPAIPPLRRDPLAWSVALYFGLQSAGFYAGLAWLPEILRANGYSEAAAGGLFAVCSLVSMGPALAVPVLAGRARDQRSILLALVALAVAGIGGLLVARDGALGWVVLIGAGQGGMLGLALILPVLRSRSPQATASLTAMTLSLGYLVASTGPWILGFIHDISSEWSLPLLAMLVITLAQLVPGLHSCRDAWLR